MFIFHCFFHGFSAMRYFVVNISMASPPSRMRKGRPWRGRWPYIYIYIYVPNYIRVYKIYIFWVGQPYSVIVTFLDPFLLVLQKMSRFKDPELNLHLPLLGRGTTQAIWSYSRDVSRYLEDMTSTQYGMPRRRYEKIWKVLKDMDGTMQLCESLSFALPFRTTCFCWTFSFKRLMGNLPISHLLFQKRPFHLGLVGFTRSKWSFGCLQDSFVSLHLG